MSTKEDRLPIIKSCLDGLRRGEAEPLFIGDIEWLVAEVERLRAALERDEAEIDQLQAALTYIATDDHIDDRVRQVALKGIAGTFKS